MIAILIKPLQPTEKQPLRYKATGFGMCVTVVNDYSLTHEANAAAAAIALVDKVNAEPHNAGKKVYTIGDVGLLPDGNSWATVCRYKTTR